MLLLPSLKDNAHCLQELTSSIESSKGMVENAKNQPAKFIPCALEIKAVINASTSWSSNASLHAPRQRFLKNHVFHFFLSHTHTTSVMPVSNDGFIWENVGHLSLKGSTHNRMYVTRTSHPKMHYNFYGLCIVCALINQDAPYHMTSCQPNTLYSMESHDKNMRYSSYGPLLKPKETLKSTGADTHFAETTIPFRTIKDLLNNNSSIFIRNGKLDES